MHSVGTRAHTVVYYAGVVLFIGLMFNVATSYFFSKDVDVSVSFERIQKMTNQRGTRNFVLFNVSADLTPLFNWNTKQLFVYVAAEYESSKHKVNEVVIWDDIIRNKDEALIKLTNVQAEYPFLDRGITLTGTPMKLSFNYNLMPITGLLQWKAPVKKEFVFPKIL